MYTVSTAGDHSQDVTSVAQLKTGERCVILVG